MQCSQCLTNTRVVSTNKVGHEKVQRHRQCPKCFYGFLTEEKEVAITSTTANLKAHKHLTTRHGQATK